MAKKKAGKKAASSQIVIFTPSAREHKNYVRTGSGSPQLNPIGRLCKKGKICVAGRATSGELQLQQVAAVVKRHLPDPLPGEPVSGAKKINVSSTDGYFAFLGADEVPNAECENAPNHSPNNFLLVWARFNDQWYGPATRQFYGQCNSQYCECDRPD